MSPYQKFGYSNCSDIKFLPDGSRFVACYQRHFPALYSIHSNNPTCIFYGFEYSNYTTTKSLDVAVWGNSTYVIAGSDYKKIYTWRVPSSLSIPGDTNKSCLDGTTFDWDEGNGVQMVHSPHQTISSCHRGNVNNVLFNRELNCFYASGVENAIVLHTPYRLGFHLGDDNQPALTKENDRFLKYYESAYFKLALPRILRLPEGGDDQLSETDAIKKMVNIPSKHLWLLANRLRMGLERKSHLDPFKVYG